MHSSFDNSGKNGCIRGGPNDGRQPCMMQLEPLWDAGVRCLQATCQQLQQLHHSQMQQKCADCCAAAEMCLLTRATRVLVPGAAGVTTVSMCRTGRKMGMHLHLRIHGCIFQIVGEVCTGLPLCNILGIHGVATRTHAAGVVRDRGFSRRKVA